MSKSRAVIAIILISGTLLFELAAIASSRKPSPLTTPRTMRQRPFRPYWNQSEQLWPLVGPRKPVNGMRAFNTTLRRFEDVAERILHIETVTQPRWKSEHDLTDFTLDFVAMMHRHARSGTVLPLSDASRKQSFVMIDKPNIGQLVAAYKTYGHLTQLNVLLTDRTTSHPDYSYHGLSGMLGNRNGVSAGWRIELLAEPGDVVFESYDGLRHGTFTATLTKTQGSSTPNLPTDSTWEYRVDGKRWDMTTGDITQWEPTHSLWEMRQWMLGD